MIKQIPGTEVEVVTKLHDGTVYSLGIVELKPSSQVGSIFEKVWNLMDASENNYEDLEVSIWSKTEQVNLNPYKNKTLSDIGVCCDPNSSYKLKAVIPKQKVSFWAKEVVEDDLSLGASASPTTADFLNRMDCFNEETPLTLAVRDENDEYASSSSKANYVGLVNQAMTCYLNSLLQALYMTPEFRNALYNWEFDGMNESRSIPFQLQKLFLNLQTSCKSAVETTDLTTSFGWQGSDAWQQHDIQELCRVMFDALEQKFKATKQANLINDLYEGKMLDYVRCLECSTEKSREDTFQDIPLPVRPFGSHVAYNSVEEALRAFVQPETLDGNDQYYCENCGKKCNAHKGLKFTKFPYLLTLHLKRFDFDYNSLHRIKLNDKVTFPETLNLNSFITNLSTECNEQKETIVKYDDCCTTDSGSVLEDEGADTASTVNSGQDTNYSESDEGIDVSSGNNHNLEAKGPYLYDLFSIMIHSGSATGGHYYAYIKDFEKQKWYCFNDQSVTRITEEDIQRTYGGGNPHRGYYSGAYSSSTNAYMLMYRQIDRDRNASPMSIGEFPPHIKDLLKNMREKEEFDRRIKEKENDFVKITVYCYHPREHVLLDAKVSVLIDTSLKDTTVYTAMQRFKLEGIVAIEDCRLVTYNKSQDCIEFSFDDDNIKFRDMDFNIAMIEWLLEIKPPDAKWPVYKPGAVNMKVYPIDLRSEELEEPTTIRVNAKETVRELKDNLALILNQPRKNLLEVVMEKYAHLVPFQKDDQIVDFEHRHVDYKLFVGFGYDDECDKSFIYEKMKKVIGRIRQSVALKINLPEVNAKILEHLSIPAHLLDTEPSTDTLASGDRNSPLLNSCASPPQTLAPCCNDGFGDQSNSEDSSLSDSDRTLVGDAPGDGLGISSSSSNSPADQHMTSTTDLAEDSYNYDVLGNPSEEMHWDDDESERHQQQQQSLLYFKIMGVVEEEANEYRPYTKYCKVVVDKRTTLERLKKYLAPYVRVPVNYFKIFRQYSIAIPTEDEWPNLSDTLKCTRDGDCFSVRLGRVLRKDEYSIKVHLLKPNDPEPVTLLFDHVLAKGQSVAQVHSDIFAQAKKRHQIDEHLPYQKTRLREKAWKNYAKNAKKVYLEDQIFGDDIHLLSSGMELFLQVLDDAETVTSSAQTVFFVRRWRPSTLELEPLQEVVVDTYCAEELHQKVAALSGIPLEHCKIAFVKVYFPGDMHRLEIDSDLDWKSGCSAPFESMCAGDGSIFFYRDNREQPRELTAEERKLIHLQENKRLGLLNNVKTYSPSKERALKIYLDSSPYKKDDNCAD